MRLDSLKPAWKQAKIWNAMPHLDPEEILSIIEGSENRDRSKLQRVLFNLAMVIVITFFCQGG